MAVGITLDAGTLVAFERGQRRAVALVARARERGERLCIPAGVIGQVRRDGRRQANLSRLLGSGSCAIVGLDDHGARAAGQLLGVAGGDDVIDATVVLCARSRRHRVATSDAHDMHRLEPRVELVIM
ncbi:MAG: PIN domain nuclease [Actinomycetota bacterium]|nr:PIN domain nuclease [Actinomycetota bacterium]